LNFGAAVAGFRLKPQLLHAVALSGF